MHTIHPAGLTRWARERQRPVQRFLATEAGSAGVLLAATVLALVWANSPASDSYVDLWHTELSFALGGYELRHDLHWWVNDGLMVFFFFLVGMEVRRELSLGELTERDKALIPALAALGGMLVPAGLYLAVNAGGPGADGWGIVMATDIAFVIGLLALVGPTAPSSLRVFLLTLAIVDDIGAIVVIAVFYSSGVELAWLVAAVAIAPLVLVVNRVGSWRGPAYVVVGVALWIAMVESGIHPTLAGVVVGVLVDVHPPRRADVELAARLTRLFRLDPSPQLARMTRRGVVDAVSANERLQDLWHPWSSFVVVPLFALANAGIAIDGEMLEAAAGSAITWGIVVGLVAGKLLGVVASTTLAVRAGIGPLPEGVRRSQLLGGGALAGIGFTVSLFVAELAFEDEALRDEAKVGVLVASVLAAVLATVVFRLSSRGEAPAETGPPRLAHLVRPELDHVRGPADAPLELLEYGDYECPYCGRSAEVVDELRARLGDRLRFVWRHLPLEDVHPGARLAAESAEAAGAQGRFWEMHDRLLRDDEPVDLSRMVDHAQALGLDLDRFVDDVQEHVASGRIALNVRGAEDSRAEGTPTFYINGVRHDGDWDADTLQAALEGSGAHRGSAPTRDGR
ncbi:Na+/H+ antiporter NhaA [Conexibacter sp. SYSU D00693]|uniref:Na+/H+ antiporter NhaA n=1 Tax=Conexibacter sp. SYSU D00693 TaxID=2812560 RepID=UPI00196A4AA7|nr:Na+/H+ antiporter NhaA [Conexibacter sp. SYSU D00693]